MLARRSGTTDYRSRKETNHHVHTQLPRTCKPLLLLVAQAFGSPLPGNGLPGHGPFGFGWTSLIPILLSEDDFGVLPIELPLTIVQTLATLVGLALPVFLVTAATGGKEGVRDLLRRLLRWRVGVHWYLIALFGLLVAMLLAAIPR